MDSLAIANERADHDLEKEMDLLINGLANCDEETVVGYKQAKYIKQQIVFLSRRFDKR